MFLPKIYYQDREYKQLHCDHYYEENRTNLDFDLIY